MAEPGFDEGWWIEDSLVIQPEYKVREIFLFEKLRNACPAALPEGFMEYGCQGKVVIAVEGKRQLRKKIVASLG